MALTKQSIRGKVKIYANGDLVDKDFVIEQSKNWNEKLENFFKKMLKQGGNFRIKNIRYEIKPDIKPLNSDGEEDGGITKIGQIEF